jgi:two-component system sensor histidine kinase HydH
MLGIRSIFIALGVFTVIALCFKPLERKIQELIDKLLFKKTRETLEAENRLLLEEVQKQDRLRSIATLAAGMAHEIKNPLTTIKTFAEYRPDKYDDPDFRKKFSKIAVDEVERVNHIVGQLLDFAKPKAPDLKPTRIEGVIDETLDLLSNNLLKARIQIAKEYSPTPEVPVDRNQMKQVFLNLFLNSIHAMPQGGVLTVATSSNGSKPGIRISVRDTGKGIAKEHLSHIFDPFYTTNSESGTGLGLAIVYGIVKEHGGTIRASSEEGKGAEFEIRLG